MRIRHTLTRFGVFASIPMLVGWIEIEEGTPVRSYSTLTLLPDGTALVAGGLGAADSATNAASVYDPIGHKFIDAPPMIDARSGHTAVALLDGRILVFGGNSSSQPVESAEIFDRWTNTWTTVAKPLHSWSSVAVLLQDGRVFVKPTFSLNTADIYDPMTDMWSSTTPGPANNSCDDMVPLVNGVVLCSSGSTFVTYDPKQDSWAAVASPGPFVDPRVFVGLPDGRVLLVATTMDSPDGMAAIYSPFTNTWTPAAAPPAPVVAAPDVLTAVLGDGTVLVTTEYQPAPTTYIYVPTTNSWKTTPPPAEIHEGSRLLSIPVDNSALLIGTMGSFLYYPGDMGCTTDLECSSGYCVHGTCCESSCGAPCHTCSLPGFIGQCVVEPAGMDLHGDCKVSNSCASTCDGKGECMWIEAKSMCAPSKCINNATLRAAAYCFDEGPGCASEDAREIVSCLPYACIDGACENSCFSNAQCADGFGCNPEGRCVQPPLPQYGGCYVMPPAPGDRVSWFVVVAAGALVLRRRRLV